ncbi:DUF7133 domain-containing protein [Albibacterium indicum]|uniref:DUF7133 domain-containing protein n=1 Tax=Albibacterium indicum TaxID=2292082 RepID=UPI000E4DD7AE|nr:c-type cytochrome [Pedobacter indicus]
MIKHIAGLILIMLFFSCRSDINGDQQIPLDSAEIQRIITDAPELDPEEAIRAMVVEEGFEVKLVASEPLISSPVAMNFDSKGRIWVVEMNNYMPDADGTGEEEAGGKIVILEDTNQDLKMDSRTVFLDSLVLPRALCLVGGGILVAEPPYLWYYQIENDKPINKQLIDSAYTEGGNVEAQSNGLYRAMDNWIYSSGSQKRYRKVGEEWLTDTTHLRGQWGISQDDQGRLYYNNNSQNILGDFFLPSLGAANPDQRTVSGFNERIVPDKRVFPIRPTPGVNRGYQDNVLDDSLRLRTFTAASGPIIYRGDLFKDSYYQNAFVGEPAANLIKRNILKKDGFTIHGEPAYEGKEFLASYDERFRPVTLYNGPDGALYIVDMYRGIIQHKLFLTDYLRSEIDKRDLDQPINLGRIYKVIPKDADINTVEFPENPKQLAQLLSHKNGWVRDQAQQIIIDKNYKELAPALRDNLRNKKNSILATHSLWTLEGLGELQTVDIRELLNSSERELKIQALTAMSSILDENNVNDFAEIFSNIIQTQDSISATYLAFQLGHIRSVQPKLAQQLREDLTETFPQNRFILDAIISTLSGREKSIYDNLGETKKDTSLLFVKKLENILATIESNKANRDINLLRKKYSRGVSIFRSTCQPCHGADGNGIESLAPPLNNSDWVQGNKERLIAIVLYGLRGPITVAGKSYDHIGGEMPGIGTNIDIVDEDISQLLSFIRQNWNNDAPEISREEVIKIRKKYKDRQEAFTQDELYRIQ